MVGKPLVKLFLFSCFFSFILSEYDLHDKIINSAGTYSGLGSKSYQMNFGSIISLFNNYIHIGVQPTSKNIQMAIISETEQCLEKRKALSIQPYDTIHLFLTKSQIQELSTSKKELYLCVKCQNEENCGYNIILDSNNECQLNIGEQASYYVTSKNQDMSFKFINKQSNNMRNLATIYDYYNFWVKGQNIVGTSLMADGVNIPSKSFGYGDVYITKISPDEFTLKVKSIEGDYVTVGALGISNSESKTLRINDLEIMGILNDDLSQICFPFNKDLSTSTHYLAQINGNVYSKKAIMFDIYNENERKHDHLIDNGLIYRHVIVGEDMERTKFCITYDDSDDQSKELIFSLQLTCSTSENKNQYIFPPQLPGVIYSHFLPKGAIGVFRGMTPKAGAKEINFNVKAIKGFPDMKFDGALDFPEAQYDEDRIVNIRNPHHANRMTVFSFYLDDPKYADLKNYNSISSEQPLIIVECLEGVNAVEQQSLFCEFETSIFSDLDRINLVEKETFSQYLLKDETDLYTINIDSKKELHKIYLDLIVFSGDVNFEVENKEDFVSAHKYYLSNKIFYSITVNEGNTKVNFKVTAHKNSFYIVVYQLVKKGDESKNINEIESGVNYIQSIYVGEDADYMKYVKMTNLKFEQGSPFLMNFYSENCQFIISRVIKKNEDGTTEEEYLPMYDSYSQLIIGETDPYYWSSTYTFKVDITADDSSQYNNKTCMMYVTGLELSNSEEGSERTISVSEGVPQYYTFTKDYPYMKYTYFVSDINNELVINFNLLDKGTFHIKVLHHYNIIREADIYRNEQIMINKTELLESCIYNDEVCPVDIYIELSSTGRDRRVETTIYQINGAPIYLEKNAIKQDIIFSSVRKRYYLDIGKYESGDITMDYIRGSGYIYATIVDKNKGYDTENSDWRGMYKFPTSKEKTLSYETYLKKIEIKKEDTRDCDGGCYILITVISSVYDESSEANGNYIPYRITITPRILPEGYEQSEYLVPKIKMKVNQFVTGNLLKSNDKILAYYKVTLPYESDHIIIDWQADKPSLYINIGDERPQMGNCDFSLSSVGHDTVYRIAKEEILKKAIYDHNMDLKDSIRNVNLTIGLWTDSYDTLYTSMYSFKIFMPPIYTGEQHFDRRVIEIIHIRSDQKVQCHPTHEGNNDNRFSCLFAVVFDEGDIGKNLVVYPRAQLENLQVNFIGSIVDAKEVEKNNMQFIVDTLEYPEDQYSSNGGKKYLYYENIEKDKCLLFSVEIETDSVIEVLSSIYTYAENQIFVPNPSTPQVFAIKDKRILFNFETSQDLLINIVSISGNGYFFWEKEEDQNINYYLNGFEDRLTLTSGIYEKDHKLSKLVAQSTVFTMFQPDDSGFVFYVSFYPRNAYYNIDQLKVGRATEINYREAEFPLYFFAKLNVKDIGVSFTFYNYYLEKDFKLLYGKDFLSIWGKVITENEALEARRNGVKIPTSENSILGIYDGAFGTLFLNSKDVDKFNVKEEDHPYLFLAIEMKEIKPMFSNGISMEVSILREQSENEQDFCVPEFVYLNGKLSNSEEVFKPSFIYKLKTDPSNPFMNVEFSSNSDLIKWDLAYDKELERKIQANKQYLNGRYIMTFEVDSQILLEKKPVYLVVHNDGLNKINPRLGNYVFKYMNGQASDSFYYFPQEKNLLEYSIKMGTKGKIYSISFYPVEQYDVNYYVKAVYRDTKIDGEREDTIAISESEGYYLQIDNPEFDGEKTILTFEIPDTREIAYIKVLAQINFFSIKEYLLYKPIEIYEDDAFPPVTPEDIYSTAYGDIINKNYNITSRQIKLNAKGAPKIQDYKLSFKDNKEIPNYINIKITNINNNNKNKIIYFSPDNRNSKENRIQLAQTGVEDSVNIWIKREELTNNFLYATVECQISEEEKCDYLIEFTGYKYVVIDSTGFNYNYYVNDKNYEMKFAIKNDLNIIDINDQTLTLYANGGKDINIKLGNCLGYTCNQYKFGTGSIITTKIQSHNFFELTVQAQVGDYISIGSKITGIDGKSESNVLKSNSYQITGYLKKGILEKECYSLPEIDNYSNEMYYLVGMFHNTAAKISFLDNSDKIIQEETITQGYYSYVHKNEGKDKKYFCIELPEFNKYIVANLAYSLQLTQPSNTEGKEGLFNLYSPQLSGLIYPRIIPKGSFVFFNGANLKSDSEDIIYNMISLEGLPQMYIYKCTDYPLCNFDFEDTNLVTKISEINRMSTWHNQESEKTNSPIDKTQYIMIVKCEDLTKTSSGSDREYCKFLTSIYGNKDKIYLYEGQSFSQYILKDRKTQYIIDFSFEADATKIHVDTLVVSGDVTFTLKNGDKNIIANKYYLANKIFYSIHLSEPSNFGLKTITVDISAKADSYYIIEYKVARGGESELSNTIYEGINYLIPFSPNVGENRKTVRIHNSRLLKDSAYLVSFYSLNCIFKINKIDNDSEEQIGNLGNYNQDLITEYNNDEFITYDITAVEADTSKYTNNMCMLYTSGIEIIKDAYSNAQKGILIGEGIPQKLIFQDGLPTIEYIYPIPDKNKNIAIHLKVINTAEYEYVISFNKKDNYERKSFSKSLILYEDNAVLNGNCGESDLCNIIISINVLQNLHDFIPIIELSIRQIDNVPYYIPKGVIRQDFVAADSWLNVFTTLGKDDEGYITLDFARGSGEIYAKIVQFNGNADPNPDWRQYKFPREQIGTLKYEFYNKKIIFTNKETKECDNGCYLLLSLRSSAIGHLDSQYRFHQLSITVGLTPSVSGNEPIIQIDPEEYVVGSLTNREKIKNKKMYEYYQLSIPFDADKIQFDWQSDSAILLINIGEQKPTIELNHYNETFRSDGIFELRRDDIMNKYLPAGNTLMSAIITIGVYTEDYESIYGTAYSFRVHFVSKEINIYKVSSDQKTLCKPEPIENTNNYRCLYMITFGELDFIYDLMIYARSQSPSALTYMYADFISKSVYDSFNVDELKNKIPKEGSKYDTKKYNIDFIFLTLSELDSHFYVSVVSDKPDVIEFVTSFKTFDTELSPNPSSLQLFSINNYQNMKLKFITTKPLYINIVSLYGDSKLYLEKNPETKYSLRGRDDRLSLAIPHNSGSETILMVENNKKLENNNDLSDSEEIEMPQLAFYLEYYIRSIELNLDEIYFGKTDEIVYKKSDFPFYYYAKLTNVNNDVNAFFILHDLEFEKENENKEISSYDIDIRGTIISQKTIYLIKVNEESKPNLDNSPIIGVYDPALQVGEVFFTTNELKTNLNNPTIYLSIEKRSKDIILNSARIELAAVQENTDVIVTEKLYQYGKIKEKAVNTYKLKVGSLGYMRIQFSTNSENVKYSINKLPHSKEEDKEIVKEIKEERGKTFITFEKPNAEYIYLHVFLNENIKNKKIASNNYAFKYINSDSKEKFYEYKIKGGVSKPTFKDEEKEYTVVFNKIEEKENIDVIYSLKGVEPKNYKNENFKTIALTESYANVTQKKNPAEKDQVTLSLAKTDGREFGYLQVIAQIRDGPITEYVAYDTITLKVNSNEENNDKSNKNLSIIFIVIGVVLFVVIIILVIIIFTFNAKNKDLMDQVNKISFVQSGAKPNDDVNLLLDNQNELE